MQIASGAGSRDFEGGAEGVDGAHGYDLDDFERDEPTIEPTAQQTCYGDRRRDAEVDEEGAFERNCAARVIQLAFLRYSLASMNL